MTETAAVPFGKSADFIVRSAEPFNAEPPPGLLGRSALTPHAAFYVRNHGRVPELDAVGHRVVVDGLVERSLELSVADLRSQFTAVEVTATLQCAGNRRTDLLALAEIPGEIPWDVGAVGTARWRGARLAEVLAAAGVAGGAAHVEFLGLDETPGDRPGRFGGSVPLAKALSPEVVLAYEMNGEPLAPVHGAPLRALIPGYVGARSVKWLARVALGARPSTNHFQAKAYKLFGPGVDPASAPPGAGLMLGDLAVNSAILAPAPGAGLEAGRVAVTGWAVAGGRAIARVDVSGDDGASWVPAELLEDQGPWAWRMWRAELELAPGEHRLRARAWDAAAQTQPEEPVTTWNPKGYANTAQPRVTVRVR